MNLDPFRPAASEHPVVGKPMDRPTKAFYNHSSGQRVNTDATLAVAIRTAYPDLHLTIVPRESADLLGFAQRTGEASFRPLLDSSNPIDHPLAWRIYQPPAHRLDGDQGILTDAVKFGKFAYSHNNVQYIVYVSDCRDGTQGYQVFVNQYILHKDNLESQFELDSLIQKIGAWSSTLHNEIWVFDQGWWQKQSDLWESINKSSWDVVILDEEEKKSLRDDANKFFNGRQRYERYKIAWKRGVIYYGPPGNGKTISIKALSNELYNRKESVPTLYVRSLTSYGGPEYSIQQIFSKARSEAPCLLVFEDLDSLVTDQVRSYFLNQVDGLNTNQGVYMIGSTNHMDRLDPGISKRPSRFDRKFNFPKPDEAQRVMYAEFWRHKLQKSNDDGDDLRQLDQGGQDEDEEDLVHVDHEIIEFPKELSPEIAKITDGFSFAYLQEAFVATLLTIAVSGDEEQNGEEENQLSSTLSKMSIGRRTKDKFDDLLFWRVIKQQIETLREQI